MNRTNYYRIILSTSERWVWKITTLSIFLLGFNVSYSQPNSPCNCDIKLKNRINYLGNDSSDIAFRVSEYETINSQLFICIRRGLNRYQFFGDSLHILPTLLYYWDNSRSTISGKHNADSIANLFRLRLKIGEYHKRTLMENMMRSTRDEYEFIETQAFRKIQNTFHSLDIDLKTLGNDSNITASAWHDSIAALLETTHKYRSHPRYLEPFWDIGFKLSQQNLKNFGQTEDSLMRKIRMGGLGISLNIWRFNLSANLHIGFNNSPSVADRIKYTNSTFNLGYRLFDKRRIQIFPFIGLQKCTAELKEVVLVSNPSIGVNYHEITKRWYLYSNSIVSGCDIYFRLVRGYGQTSYESEPGLVKDLQLFSRIAITNNNFEDRIRGISLQVDYGVSVTIGRKRLIRK